MRQRYNLRLKEQLREWNEKVSEMRLQEMRLQHTIRVMEGRNKFLDEVNSGHEEAIANLQQKLNERESELTEKAREWNTKQREVEERENRVKLAEALKRLENDKFKHKRKSDLKKVCCLYLFHTSFVKLLIPPFIHFVSLLRIACDSDTIQYTILLAGKCS